MIMRSGGCVQEVSVRKDMRRRRRRRNKCSSGEY